MSSMSVREYKQLLDRALKGISISSQTSTRLVLPELKVEHPRNRTIVRNFSEYFRCLRRDPNTVLGALSKKIGYRCSIQQDSLFLLTKIQESKILEIIQGYVTDHVRCAECLKLDTTVRGSRRHRILHCEACGAEKRQG